MSQKAAVVVTRSAGRQMLDQTVTEKHLQRDVVALARQRGWLVYHPWSSVHSQAGFPDLTMVRCLPNGDRRVIFAELKTEKGKVSTPQRHWLGALALVAQASACAISVYTWRPSDFDKILEVLK